MPSRLLPDNEEFPHPVQMRSQAIELAILGQKIERLEKQMETQAAQMSLLLAKWENANGVLMFVKITVAVVAALATIMMGIKGIKGP